MNVISSKLGKLKLADSPFASGGAGEVYRAVDSNGKVYCVKILNKQKPKDIEKIKYMVANPLNKIEEGWGMICWPIDLVSKYGEVNYLGYVMPMALSESVELLKLTNIRWPGKTTPALASKLDRTSKDGLMKRMLISCNISAAVNTIHQLGYVFVDLKPQNILLSPDGRISLVDLDSLQIVVGSEIFHGPLGSPEYMPSESYKIDFTHGPKIDPSWDYFSLAVIFYEILLGIHPFTASTKSSIIGCESIAEAIRFRMYVHGNNRSNLDVIPAPHSGIGNIPLELANLFLKAFDTQNPAQRPSAREWGEAMHNAAKGGVSSLPKKIFSISPPAIIQRSKPTVPLSLSIGVKKSQSILLSNQSQTLTNSSKSIGKTSQNNDDFSDKLHWVIFIVLLILFAKSCS